MQNVQYILVASGWGQGEHDPYLPDGQVPVPQTIISVNPWLLFYTVPAIKLHVVVGTASLGWYIAYR